MRRRRKTPLAAVLQGLAAGLIGNATFTAYQELQTRLRSSDSGEADEQGEEREEEARPPEDWSETPTPAQVGQRVVEGVFKREVSTEQAGLLTNVTHWLYGTSWGALYGLLEETRPGPARNGVMLAGAVMVADYTLLPAMKLYRPPWEYGAKTLGKDFANHVVYGLAVAGAYWVLDEVTDGREPFDGTRRGRRARVRPRRFRGRRG